MSTGGTSRGLLRPAAVVALLALTLAVYLPVRQHGFIERYDDVEYLTGNPAVRGGLSARGIAWAFTSLGYAANWHPLTWLSHMLDVELFGLDAGGHHLVSLLLHLANVALLFCLLARLTGRGWSSLLVAALFAVHPLHVESVAWVAERKDVLSTFLGLASLHAYLEWSRRRRPAWYAASLALFALGLMAKPMLVTLPFLLLLLDWWPLGRLPAAAAPSPGRLSRPVLAEKLPYLALAAGSGLLTMMAQESGRALSGWERLGPGRRLANALLAYAGYLGKAVWPEGLSPFYPMARRPEAPWKLLLAFLALAALTALALRLRRSRPHLAAGWLWYLGTLLPVIGLVQVGSQAMADRYTYLPLTGVFIMVAWELAGAAEAARRRWRPAAMLAAAAAVVAVVMLAVAARAQVRWWRDGLTLFGRAVAVDPGNWFARTNLGVILESRGRTDEAVAQLRAAIAALPGLPEAHNNLGVIHASHGRPLEAAEEFRTALRSDPGLPEPHDNLGLALAAVGRVEEAAREHRRALELDPGYARAANNLGVALYRLGRPDEAGRWFREAVRLDPAQTEALANLGVLLEGQGRAGEALFYYRQALRTGPDHPTARAGVERLAGPGGGAGR